MPREHFEKITNITSEKVGELFSKIPKIAKAVIEATKADAFFVAQYYGRAAKQFVPHVHIHIIPRYAS